MAEFASKGVGAAGLTTGVIGSALGAMNSGILPNIFGGRGNNGVQHVISTEDMPVSRYEAGISSELSSAKAEIGLLKSQVYVDQKITEAYASLRGEIDKLEGEVRKNKDEQTAINMQQAVYNGVNTATIECIKNQIAQIMGLTKLVVPNGSVCPGWGDVTVQVTPATSTATAPTT